MFPYTKYLHCLLVTHNRDFPKVAVKLRSAGIYANTAVLETFYEQFFLAKLPEHLRCLFRHNLSIHSLHPIQFNEVALNLKIGSFFNERRIFDSERFDGILKNRLLQRHVECSFIGKLSPAEICDDIRSTYNIMLHPHLLEDFRSLFMDLSQVRHQNDWVAYMKTLPRDEQIFRNALLLQQDKDYIRWKLGVHVRVDRQYALESIATDMFYRYKESLADMSPGGIDTSRRISDTAMKALDKLTKMKSLDKGKTKSKDFNALLLTFSDDNAETINDLDYSEAKSVGETDADQEVG